MIIVIRRILCSLACLTLALGFLGASLQAQSASAPARVYVDSTRAPQHFLRTHEQLPVQPGPLTLYYAEWIPGDHEPDGPLNNVAGLIFTANGKTIPWHRDLVDMFAIHLDIPPGASALDIDFDFLLAQPSSTFGSSASATAFLDMVTWNQLLLYPKGVDAANISFLPSLRLPAGWKFATALTVTKQDGDNLEFAPVSLETLVDSPVLTGRYLRTIDLSPGETPDRELDMASDSPSALELTPEMQTHLRQLIPETEALFHSHHYRNYRFLASLSDDISHYGLEHHESSDDRMAASTLTDPQTLQPFADWLAHEYVHSWNGKYRRPTDLLSPDYHKPMEDDLLWVYEGLTDYLGQILTARSGVLAEQQTRDVLAVRAAQLDSEPGRQWRSLQDDSDSTVFLQEADGDWRNLRRSLDIYDEGDFLWLGVDGTIRRLTGDKKSIDDFCQLFYGGPSGQPAVSPYKFEDVVAALNQIAPFDWTSYLRTRLDSLAPPTPDEALANSGWKLVYTDQPNDFEQAYEAYSKSADFRFTVGLVLGDNGKIGDVIYDGPAFKAGLGPGMKIVAVNGRMFSAEAMNDAIKDAVANTSPIHSSSVPIQLVASNGTDVETYSIDYHNGLRYPHLVRDDAKPDYLSEIVKPHATK